MTVYNVPFAAYDYYVRNGGAPTTGTTIIFAQENLAAIPNLSDISYGLIDTSGIPDTDVISAATFQFTANAYSATKGVTKLYTAQIWNGSTYVNMTNGTNKTWSAGTNSVVLTSTELTYISVIGTTLFRLVVPAPGTNQLRKMDVNAFETSQATAMRLDVTHAAPSTGFGQVINVMCS